MLENILKKKFRLYCLLAFICTKRIAKKQPRITATFNRIWFISFRHVHVHYTNLSLWWPQTICN